MNEQLHNNTDEDFKMMEQLEHDEQHYNIDIGQSTMKCVFLFDIRTVEQMLLKSVECYEAALAISETENILQRLGNGLNEVASFYLNIAKTEKNMDDIIMTSKKAETYLIRGLEVFDKIKDKPNTALLYSNMGHLHRYKITSNFIFTHEYPLIFLIYPFYLWILSFLYGFATATIVPI